MTCASAGSVARRASARPDRSGVLIDGHDRGDHGQDAVPDEALQRAVVAGQAGAGHQPGVEDVGAHRAATGQLVGEEHVAELARRVAAPALGGRVGGGGMGERPRAAVVRLGHAGALCGVVGAGADDHHPRVRHQAVAQQGHEQEVPQVVDLEGPLDAVLA